MSRERESEAREVLARSPHAAILPPNHSPMQAAVIAAMLEFAALSTSVQSAASTFHETGDSLKVAEAVREAAIRAALCLSGFIGEGLEVDGIEPPEDAWCRIAVTLGVPEADDDDLRALLVNPAIRAMTLDNAKGEEGER